MQLRVLIKKIVAIDTRSEQSFRGLLAWPDFSRWRSRVVLSDDPGDASHRGIGLFLDTYDFSWPILRLSIRPMRLRPPQWLRAVYCM